MKLNFIFLGLVMFQTAQAQDSLNMTISGDAQDRVELETLSPTPDIPKAEALPFSKDGGKQAIEEELSPLSLAEAARQIPPATLPTPNLPLIPSAPFIVQFPPKNQPADNNWEFRVVDERNHLWHMTNGQGVSPDSLAWDGTDGQKFILDPNRTYYSYFVSSSAAKGVTSAPGEATRFIALVRMEDKDSLIAFGERVYVQGEARFSEEGKIYLNDLVRRLSGMKQNAESDERTQWQVVLHESNQPLGKDRQQLWAAFLEQALQRKITPERIVLHPIRHGNEEEASVTVTLKETALPSATHAMRGRTAPGSVSMELMASLIKIRNVKDVVIVECRHDQLFRPGTAYLRDEALPYVTQAMGQIPKNKKILLRSYTEKVRDKEKEKEEDPKLTAMRTKVLFSLFAESALVKKP